MGVAEHARTQASKRRFGYRLATSRAPWDLVPGHLGEPLTRRFSSLPLSLITLSLISLPGKHEKVMNRIFPVPKANSVSVNFQEPMSERLSWKPSLSSGPKIVHVCALYGLITIAISMEWYQDSHIRSNIVLLL